MAYIVQVNGLEKDGEKAAMSRLTLLGAPIVFVSAVIAVTQLLFLLRYRRHHHHRVFKSHSSWR